MRRILLIDLNNFAGYPSVAIGYLVAALRQGRHHVEVLSPLAVGVRPPAREVVETPWHHWERRISYSTRQWLGPPRKWLGRLRQNWRAKKKHQLVDACRAKLQEDFDIVLISAYTDERLVCEEIARMTHARQTPLLIGGPIFNQTDVAMAWVDIPGVTAVVGTESERSIAKLVDSVVAGDSLEEFEGVFQTGGLLGPKSRSERSLDELLVPDFDDFPWQDYEHKIIPVLASRGCGWGKCTFCGDIVTANGRGYRARTVENVVEEMKTQSERYGTHDFAFLDLKLNSRTEPWRQLIETIGSQVPQARWIGAVHVEAQSDCGLDREDLKRAREAGMARVTFGLESGSQRILDAMDKGTRVERNLEFIHDAHQEGLSVRTTVIQGYPGETAEELHQTAAMLESASQQIDRVRLNRLNVLEGTRMANDYQKGQDQSEGLKELTWEHSYARSSYRYPRSQEGDYRQAMRRVLKAVHHINRKPIQEGARNFHGVM